VPTPATRLNNVDCTNVKLFFFIIKDERKQIKGELVNFIIMLIQLLHTQQHTCGSIVEVSFK
jgi:hypothetical protein